MQQKQENSSSPVLYFKQPPFYVFVYIMDLIEVVNNISTTFPIFLFMASTKAQLDRAGYIVSALMKQAGVTDFQAAGMAGCWMAESGCDPQAYNKAEKAGTFKGSSANGAGYGAGIAQWSNARKAALQRLVGNYTPIESWSLDQQIAAALKEIKPKYLTQWKNCKDAVAATDLALRGFENGGGGSGGLASIAAINKYTWCGGYNGAMATRAGFAAEILKSFRAGNGGGNVDGSELGDISLFGFSGAIGGGVLQSYESDAPSVLSIPSENIYSNIQVADSDQDIHIKHTRIYKYSDPTIKVPELSISLDGQESPVDPESGQHIADPSVEGDQVEDPQKMQRAGQYRPNYTLGVGVIYPIIRINDYYISENEIESFEIETRGFIPTMKLQLFTPSNTLLKHNTIKEGDKCAIFISPGHGMIKSLKAEFVITYTNVPTQSQMRVNRQARYQIFGELYIPDLYNAGMTFSFAGSSRDALIDVAQKLGLGFFFNDPENTDDIQMWYCMSEEDDDQPGNTDPIIIKYIKTVAQHAWKNFNSFFDCWIDPRYGLSFININKQLGEEGQDEAIDVAIFNNIVTNNRAVDKDMTSTDEEKKKQAKPQLKIFNNVSGDPEALTSYYIVAFNEVNQAAAITQQIGVKLKTNYVIDNQGVDQENNAYQMDYSIPVNSWKIRNGFYILIGPGQNESYIEADNGSYVDKNQQVQGGRISDIQADTDSSDIAANGNNILSTGNINKFFDAAVEHNRINNLQLKKRVVRITLQGLNLQIMRGEKIPVILIDNNAYTAALGGNERTVLSHYLFENLSGWFIIDAVKYVYKKTGETANISGWTTQVDLVRREWPIPGKAVCPLENEEPEQAEQAQINIDQSGGTTVEGADISGNGSMLTVDGFSSGNNNSDDTYTDASPTDGLEPFMLDIYDTVRDDTALVSARRYAVDEDGERIENPCNAYVVNGGLYKCMDSQGHILYFSNNNSRHLYGEAIDIVPKDGSNVKDYVAEKLINNIGFLKLCYDNGVSAYIEKSKDDTGTVSDHIHIGTDTSKQKIWWELVANAHRGYTIGTSSYSFNFANYAANNKNAQAEITHANVKEAK